MELDVSKAFLAPGKEFPFEEKLALPPQDVAGETVTFEDVTVQGVYTMLEDSVHLRGTLETIARGECAMCMEEASVPLNVSFAEVFRKGADETEEEEFCLEGKSISLSQMALTLVMLNLPMRFLCRESCKGSPALQRWQKNSISSSHDEGTLTRRPFEALQSLLKKDEEV